MLKIALHGGKCCGIKTIHGFGWYLNDKKPDQEPALTEQAYRVWADRNGNDFNSSVNFFTDEAPKESTLERLDRYIEFLKKWRPKGVVEIALAEGQHPTKVFPGQIAIWHEDLLARGFKVTVPKFLNSNSANWVQVYHLVYNCDAAPDEDDDEDDYEDPWEYDEEEEI